MVTKLTTIVNNNMVNELHVSYQRTTTDAYQHPPTEHLRLEHLSQYCPRVKTSWAAACRSVRSSASLDSSRPAAARRTTKPCTTSRRRWAISFPGTSASTRSASAASSSRLTGSGITKASRTASRPSRPLTTSSSVCPAVAARRWWDLATAPTSATFSTPTTLRSAAVPAASCTAIKPATVMPSSRTTSKSTSG